MRSSPHPTAANSNDGMVPRVGVELLGALKTRKLLIPHSGKIHKSHKST